MAENLEHLPKEIIRLIQEKDAEINHYKRESQIEMALEIVRSRTMAMRSSKELNEVVAILYQQLSLFGIGDWGCNIMIFNEEKDQIEIWLAESDQSVFEDSFKFRTKGHGFIKEQWDMWRTKQDENVTLTGKTKKSYDDFILNNTDFKNLPSTIKKQIRSLDTIHFSFTAMKYGMLAVIDSKKSLAEGEKAILKRFANVFQQTYTRFLDLQKAESQAREAQIVAALERVRSRSIAMRKSEEIAAIAGKIFSELRQLDLALNRVLIWTFNDTEKYTTWWSANPEVESTAESYRIDYNENPVFINYLQAWQQRKPIHLFTLSGDTKKTWEDHLFEHTEMSKLPIEVRKGMRSEGTLYTISVINDYGLMMSGSFKPLSEASIDIIKRFGRVFQQSYTRYRDVQKAEAQAREAQIEAALERVRAQTMAMHCSEDIGKCTVKMFDELISLGVPQDTRFGIGILNHDNENNQLWTASKDGAHVKIHIGNLDMNLHPLLKSVRKAWKAQIPLHRYVLEGKDLLNYYQMLSKAPDYKIPITIGKLPEREYHYGFVFEHGFFYAFCPQEFKPNLIHIIQRFSSLFGQTFRRYLDLVKAEEQAREAQIETALERVRTKTMAMHQTIDLREVVGVLYEQIVRLQLADEGCNINIFKEDILTIESWMAAFDGVSFPDCYYIEGSGHPFLKRQWEKWRAQAAPFHISSAGKELEKYSKYIVEETDLKRIPDDIKTRMLSIPELHFTYITFKYGQLEIVNSGEIPSQENVEILKRFTKVFEQSYTRFLDLQKAEAQARESEVQLALERIRARTMGMHKTEELSEVASILFQQLITLKLEPKSCALGIMDEDHHNLFFSINGKVFPESLQAAHDINPNISAIHKAWKKGEKLHYHDLSGNDLEYHNRTIQDYFKSQAIILPGEVKLNSAKRQVDYHAFFSQGFLLFTYDHLIEETSLFIRLAKVFEQTYTRFLDLQKAEAQAREAEIEAALERVRSRTMAMHHSDELNEVVATMYEQVQKLKFSDWGCSIIICDEEKKVLRYWLAEVNQNQSAEEYQVPLTKHPVVQEQWRSWKKGIPDFKIDLIGKAKDDYTEFMLTETDHRKLPEEVKRGWRQYPNTYLYYSCMRYGMLEFVDIEPLEEANFPVYHRFAQVFEQTYTRFLDLQKVEAQAREAQIEAALERVRARSMAMQHSDELSEVSFLLNKEVRALGTKTWGCAFNIYGEKDSTEWFGTEAGTMPTYKTPREGIFLKYYEKGQAGETFYIETFDGRKQIEHYEYMCTLPGVGDILNQIKASGHSFPPSQIDHLAYFKYGYLLFITLEPAPELHEIFKRFAKVFEQTYTRFLDLKKAELQAWEATKQASLDRVRAEIASMRTAQDLERITPLIWKELTILEVPFFRCGVFIINEDAEQVQVYLTNPKGDSIAALNLPFGTSDLVDRTLDHWRKAKILKQEWTRAQFTEWVQSIVEQGYLEDNTQYQGGDVPPEYLALHFVPFVQGMLYVGHDELFNSDQLELVQALAAAFEVAYARYEDFNKLESTNEALGKTLDNLKSTQNQLIQAEKMASLGELTAGIAHEIQNPLNFVNNFSEVSAELLDEIKEELEAGNLEEVEEILNDLIQNLSKIHHHGDRASSIVKGMLAHSRSGSDEKVLTDMNALCDEYLRLAYHGMRAKDKSFNASFDADLDPLLPTIEVVPQEIGRVLLNLINNAFHAVSIVENPQVIISTAKLDKHVRIAISDNGPGIPDEIRNKIFQPFFTTKPTGEGTGLGLSLSYDIVKAHGGEIKVQSEQNKGSEFIILLPIQN